MIVIRGVTVTQPPAGLSGTEAEIFRMKQAQATTYEYASQEELLFELKTRRLLTEAASDLNSSGAKFAPFRESRCNPDFWRRDSKGGFELLPGKTPAEGIRDIFMNGKKYAFECATATVIILYKGMLESLGDELFNLWFGGLLLYDWKYDQDLRLIDSKKPADALPGDVQYFKNPDVSPEFPEWQGENVLRMTDGTFFGHGIGIKSGEQIIESLNKKRKKNSTESAYLSDFVVHPDYPALYRALIGNEGQPGVNYSTNSYGNPPARGSSGRAVEAKIRARIGSVFYG